MAVDLDVGYSVVVDETAHRRPQLIEPAAAAFTHTLGQLLPGGADIACGIDEFVVTRPRPATHVEQRLLSPRGAVPGQQVVDVVRIRGGKDHYCKTVRTRRRSKMPGAPTSVD